MSDKHKTKEIIIAGKKVGIDRKIVKLVKMLNKFGIKTQTSCQGEKRGYISIDKKNIEIYSGIVNGKYQFTVNLKFPTPK